MTTTDKPLVARSFHKHFPDEAARAEALGIPIDAKPRKKVLGYPVYYAWRGRVQLTGYKHDEHGFLTPDQVPRVVKIQMDRIEKAIATERARSEQERFDVIVEILERAPDQYKMIAQATLGGEDHASYWCPRSMYEASAEIAGRTTRAEGRTKFEAIRALREAFARHV
jgi:hypothetical protein